MILAGDDVTRKKPDPLIYNMARERLGLSADRCIVVEDSMVGLRAAVAAGMKCIITPTTSTASADFMGEGATAVVPALAGDGYRVSGVQGAQGDWRTGMRGSVFQTAAFTCVLITAAAAAAALQVTINDLFAKDFWTGETAPDIRLPTQN